MKSYISHFNDMSNFMTWSPDAWIVAHLLNGVLPKTPLWDELQQKECWRVDEFYRKANKYLKLEDSNWDGGQWPKGARQEERRG